MINEHLEQDLTTYSQNQDAELFNQKLYAPLSNLFKWLWTRQGRYLAPSDFEDTQQKAMLNVVKNMKHYKQGKGRNATSFARLLLKQELARTKKQLYKLQSRTVSLDALHEAGEEIASKINMATVTQAFTVCEHATILTEYLPQAPKEYRKVIKAIAKTLTTKAAYQMKYIDKVKHIARTSKASIYLVKKVLKHIKQQRLNSQCT